MISDRALHLGILSLAWLFYSIFPCFPDQAFGGLKENQPSTTETCHKVNINQASLGDLKSLPGIGPVLAQRILDYRRKNPPFRRVEELLIVKGISRNKLEKIRSKITVE